MSKWISVKDRLPDDEFRVLLYFSKIDHIEDVAFFRNEYDNTRYHVLFDGDSLNSEPSHWMPLPELPND